jgi:hypothetical protein
MADELTSEERRQLDDLTHAVASELAQDKKPEKIVQELVKQGWPEDEAATFVRRVADALQEYQDSPEARRMLASKYARQMVYGIFWAVGGTAVTIWTYATATGGGSYVVAWGAIVFGIIAFFRGLFGWMKYDG